MIPQKIPTFKQPMRYLQLSLIQPIHIKFKSAAFSFVDIAYSLEI